MNPKTFTWFSDPAHGWIKVPKELLKTLGIAHKITPYSYQNGDYAYLEEDCDATTFLEAFEKYFGFTPKFNQRISDGRSMIRSYQSYRGD